MQNLWLFGILLSKNGPPEAQKISVTSIYEKLTQIQYTE